MRARWAVRGLIAVAGLALVGCGAILGLTDPTIDDNLVLDGGSDVIKRPDAVVGPDGCVSCSTSTCTDFKNDPKNCGSCGRACESNAACSGGLCPPTKIQSLTYGGNIEVDATHLYWFDGPSVFRVATASPTGTPSTLENTGNSIRGFTISDTDLFISIGGYVDGDGGLFPGTIKRCPKTGCPGANGGITIPVEGIPSTIAAANQGGSYFFWDIYYGGLKRCAYPDCLGGPTPKGFGGYAIGGIAPGNDFVFYTDDTKSGTAQGVYYCNLGGCDLSETNLTKTQAPIGIVLDAKFAYVAELFKGSILVLPRPGSGVSDPYELASGLTAPTQIAIDETYVYWSEQGVISNGHSTDGRIARCRIGVPCGTNPEVLAQGLDWASDIAVDANYVYFVTSGDKSIWRVPK